MRTALRSTAGRGRGSTRRTTPCCSSPCPPCRTAPPCSPGWRSTCSCWPGPSCCCAGCCRGGGPDGVRLGWRTWGLVPLLLVASMPFIQAMACQQNTFLSLAILTATVALWRSGRALPAGLACGLLLFKPQLAAVVAAVLVCGLGWRAAAGVAITAGGLLLLSAVTMPGALADYLHKLPALLPWLQPGRPYHWERQATFQGFWRMLLQGPVSGPARPPSGC